MGLVETPFKLSSEEILCSAVITVFLNTLSKEGIANQTVEQMCFTPQYGFTASASSIPCGPHFVRITDVKEGSINWSTVPYCECDDAENYQLYTDDILIARAGASIGKTFIAKDISTEAIFASYMIRLRARQDFNPNYIYWCLQSQQFWTQIMEAQRGSAMKNINAKMISSLTFPIPSLEIQSSIATFLDSFQIHLKDSKRTLAALPYPLEEQRRIVARIEDLAAKIEEARGLQQEAMEEKKKLALSIPSRLMTQIDCKEYKLEEICLQITDGEHITPPRVEKGEETIPLVTAKNVRDGYIDLAITDFVPIDIAQNCWHRCHPQPNDILMVCVGATTGRICRLTNVTDVVIVRSVAMIRPDKDIIHPKFLEYAMKSSDCQKQIWSLVKQAAQPGLYIHRMKQLIIRVPSLKAQKSIVAQLDEYSSYIKVLEDCQAKVSTELDALLPSILDRAFKGEL